MNTELMKTVSQLQRDVAHVSKDVAELKADRRQKDARGIRWFVSAKHCLNSAVAFHFFRISDVPCISVSCQIAQWIYSFKPNGYNLVEVIDWESGWVSEYIQS